MSMSPPKERRGPPGIEVAQTRELQGCAPSLNSDPFKRNDAHLDRTHLKSTSSKMGTPKPPKQGFNKPSSLKGLKNEGLYR